MYAFFMENTLFFYSARKSTYQDESVEVFIDQEAKEEDGWQLEY